jgi:anti-anti-sigma factor
MSRLARLEIDGGTKVCLVHVHGEIDISNAPEVSAALEAAMPNGAETLMVDLSGTTYLDSAGVQLLFLLAQRLRARRQQLRIVVPEDAPIRGVLQLTDLPRVIPMQGRLGEEPV